MILICSKEPAEFNNFVEGVDLKTKFDNLMNKLEDFINIDDSWLDQHKRWSRNMSFSQIKNLEFTERESLNFKIESSSLSN